MALPEVDTADDWLRQDQVDTVVAHLRAFARDQEGIDLDRLASAPYEVLEQHPTLAIEHSDEPSDGCDVYGHYRPDPPTIHVVRASTFGRDHFTLLHEYAHHLQQHHPEWAETEWRIKPDALRLRITEAIANQFASVALIPDPLLASVSAVPTARQMAALHKSVRASRQAAIVRVTRASAHAAAAAGIAEHFFVSLVETDGTVVFSQKVGDDLAPPPRDSHQPDIQALFESAYAADGNATRVTSEGITYSSGANRTDIRLDLHIAHDGGYAFVVGTKEHRYGSARWSKQTHLCSSAACEAEFIIDESVIRCSTCGTPRCPECRSCDCEATTSATCQRCFTELSAVDLSAGRTTHDDCPW
jgi:hypothetical protein